MEWDRETRRKLAKEILRVSLQIQEEELSRCSSTSKTNFGSPSFPEAVAHTIERIMEKLGPLGFEPADKDWKPDGECEEARIYQDSPTHLWFETAQCRIVKIKKSLAERVLVLGIP
jgi:hypothetical protein